MSLDRHRESLVKYCYDISKVAFGIAVLNPVASKVVSLVDLAIGLCVTVVFLVFALLLERGAAS
jgi:hypothetical protein